MWMGWLFARVSWNSCWILVSALFLFSLSFFSIIFFPAINFVYCCCYLCIFRITHIVSCRVFEMYSDWRCIVGSNEWLHMYSHAHTYTIRCIQCIECWNMEIPLELKQIKRMGARGKASDTKQNNLFSVHIIYCKYIGYKTDCRNNITKHILVKCGETQSLILALFLRVLLLRPHKVPIKEHRPKSVYRVLCS